MFDDGQNQIMNTEYELSFLADVKGLALQTYYVKMQRPEEGVNADMDVAAIRLLNQAEHPFQVPPFSNIEVFERGDSFTLQNG